jgi:CelD/BcsL family acetyltransferase involved in cellulose biosynthesis
MKAINGQDNLVLRAEIRNGKQAISTFADAWDKLFERSTDAPPYLSRVWIETFISEGRLRGVPLFILVWCGEELTALLALTIRHFLGVKIAEPISTCEPTYLGLLLDPRYPIAVNYVAEVLAQEKIVHCLYNTNLSSEDQPTNKLLDELVKKGFLCLSTHRNPCHYIKLKRSYDEYLIETKTAKRRKKLRYEERKLFNSRNVAIHCYRGQEVTPDVLKRVASIQEASWMKRRGAAVLGQPFYQKLFLEMAKNNLANVWLMTIDGEDAAFVYTLAAHKKIHYYRTAFKLKYESSLSVGKVLTMQIICDACNNGFLSFNFGHGDGEYKRFWATDIHYVNRAAVGCGLRGRLVVLCLGFAWWLAKHERIRIQYRRVRRRLQKVAVWVSSISL